MVQREVESGGEGDESAEPSARHELLPLTPAQRGIWFAEQLTPDYSVCIAQYIDIRHAPGDLDFDLLAECTEVVGREIESPYLRITEVDGVPMQYYDSEYDQTVERVDLRAHPEPLVEAKRWMLAEHRRTIDVLDEPLAAAAVIRVSDDHTILYQRAHHLIIDGYGALTMLKRVLRRYNALRAGEELNGKAAATLAEIVDYAASYETSSRRDKDRQHWLERADDLPEGVTLASRKAAATPSFDNVVSERILPSDLQNRIEAVARAHSTSPAVVVTAAFGAYLARVSGSGDVVLSLPVTGRLNAKLKDSAGMVSNVVPIRLQAGAAVTGADLVKAAQLELTGALRHQRYRSDDIRRDAGLSSAAMSFGPTVNMIFFDEPLAIEGGELEYHILAAGALEDLLVMLYQAGPDAPLSVDLHGNPSLYSESDLASHHERFTGFLDRFVEMMLDDPDRPLATLSLQPGHESDAVAVSARGAAPSTLREILLDGERQRVPGSVAVSGDRMVTQQEFEQTTNRLARELIAKGAGPGSVVAVDMARSAWSVIACAAVAKSGAAFVSVDPRHPSERRELLLADAGAVLGLALSGVGIEYHAGTEWIVLDDPQLEVTLSGRSAAPIVEHELRRTPHLDDPAYLIYTSGSTGTPKATVVPNRGIANLVANQQRLLGLSPESRVLHVASPSFDASVFELLMGLASGCRIVVADSDTYAGPDLEQLIVESGVTHIVMTPAALQTINPDAVPSVEMTLSAGETCPPELMRQWVDAGRSFFNLYGPTEATIWATADGPYQPADEITIGRALDGVGALVLDAALHEAPVGAAGDLYLIGEQVALGYLHRLGQTATAFVACPFVSGTRMYRTGDRAVRRADGRLDFLGRSDFQLKIRGIRIEPGEVDSALVAHPAVANAMSLGVKGPAGEMVLVSYASLTGGAQATGDELVEFLAEHLPTHMVPSSIVVIDEFPTTLVGKIDRRRLPAVEFRPSRSEYVAPRPGLEETIARSFAEILEIDQVSTEDSFFELGGTSLSAARLAARLSEVIGRKVTVRTIFDGDSVTGIAAEVEKLVEVEDGPELVALDHTGPVEISEAQRGMWLLNQGDTGSAAYNLPLVLQLSGPLDLPALRSAVADVLERQAVLRTRYPMVDGELMMVTDSVADAMAGWDMEPVAVLGSVEDAVREVTDLGFDVSASVPVSIRLLRVAADEHILALVIHHISADGASMVPLAHDLMVAYSAHHTGQTTQWHPLAVQYRDFAVWQQGRLAVVDDSGLAMRDRQLDYWRSRLSGAPESIDLPIDRPRPAEPSGRGGTVHFVLPSDLVVSLEKIARQHNSTLFMVTHAALAILLGRLSGAQDVVVGTPHAGRGLAALDELVGMFVNTLALRTAIDSAIPFSSFLEQVRDEDLADMANADVAFESVVAAVDAPRSRAFNPVFQVVFSFQNLEFPAMTLDGLTISAVPEADTPAKVDLQLTLFPNDPIALGAHAVDDSIRAELLYSADLFDRDTVQVFADRYLSVLRAIAEDPEAILADLSIATVDEVNRAKAEESDVETALCDLVADAAVAAPDKIAVDANGAVIDFSTLWGMASVMAVSMTDADSALTTALLALAPGVATAGPEVLGTVLTELRHRALEATGVMEPEESRTI
ncbi:amino acid adenylation domain-containing protein [Gordonia alkaliphila]|uniref:non-ribosomal peptide synthetase n=1 Tax=Gordonia alkaliphila TaxID=1053547 RepID=UPI001FF4B5FC|nr:non-ribosomal peptide synthetase [Gordonia alkaliphila]MCK0438397.1 amino acid adenylation domain-containing protein [Gordonia alkaliphila]